MSHRHDPRRRLLVQALTVGGFALGNGLFREAWAASNPSIHFLEGECLVNGRRADQSTVIQPHDLVETGSNSRVAFTVGQDAFIMRANSRLQIQGDDDIINTLRLLTGRLLGVFGRRTGEQRLSLRTATATMGIRGTGVYTEANEDKTYLCTCYGNTAVVSNADLRNRQVINSRYHEAVWVHGSEPKATGLISKAPMINHEDDELVLLESLVGRRPSEEVWQAAHNPRLQRGY